MCGKGKSKFVEKELWGNITQKKDWTKRVYFVVLADFGGLTGGTKDSCIM